MSMVSLNLQALQGNCTAEIVHIKSTTKNLTIHQQQLVAELESQLEGIELELNRSYSELASLKEYIENQVEGRMEEVEKRLNKCIDSVE